MSFKKHNWVKYGRRGNSLRIEVRDENEMKLDFFRCNDNVSYKTILKILKEKYGFSPEIDIEKSPNFDKKTEWLKSNKEFEW